MKKKLSFVLSLVFAIGVLVLVATAAEETTTTLTLKEVLKSAEQEGFCYMFWGEDRTFDGTRIISGSLSDIEALANSTEGTLIVRYKTSANSNQVLIAAGHDYCTNHYGAILANNVSTVKRQRIDFPNGLYANLAQSITTDNVWHTFVYSVDATDLSSTTGKTVTSFDGSITTQYPNYASWFNANETIQDLQFLTIGGSNGTLANSSNNTNFVGEIAFVAFVPYAINQAQAAVISSSDWPVAIYTAEDIAITEVGDTVAIDSTITSLLSQLGEMTIIAQYNNTGSGIGSLFSISDPTKTNSHFHLYEYGNTLGFEFRNNDSPKYSATCGGIYSGEINTVAFSATDGIGYKLFANGVLGTTISKTGTSYQFLEDMTGQTAAYLGKTARPTGINQYVFSGAISYIEIYDFALPDIYLIERTSETEREDHRVFYNGDGTQSKFFRIPFLWSTEDGTLIAGTDANFGSTGDSAENIDCAIRIKNNATSYSAMEGWSNANVPSVMHMLDYTDSVGYRQDSASFIDGVIVEDSVYNDRVYVIIDAWAWNGGVFSYLNIDSLGQAHGGTNRAVAYGDGFCTIGGQKYLLLSSQNNMGSDSHGTNNINNNTIRANFDYVADIYGQRNSDGRYTVYHLNGTPNEYSASSTTVDDSNLSLGDISVYSLSEDFELYKNGVPLTVYQRLNDTTYTDNQVAMKVFYKDSELQLYNTSYLMQFYSDDNGSTWHTGTILNGMVKPENSRYYITGPGRGIQLKNGVHAGRIIVPIYCQLSGVSGIGSPATAIIYSDDGGETWNAGNPIPTTLGLHESALVEMPNGTIKIFVRNTSSYGGKFIMATSTDGGVSWKDVQSVFGDSSAGTNCQISALGISTLIADPLSPTEEYPALLLTSAYNASRKNGRTWVGLIKENGTYDDGTTKYTIDWAYEYEQSSTNELFAYSCMTELSDGRIGLLYETSPDSSWSTGLQGIYYKEFSIEDLLES